MGEGIGGFFRDRWRVLAGGAAGIVAGLFASSMGEGAGASSLIGWNLAALIYLAPTYAIILFDNETKVRERASREDESRAVIMSLVLIAVAVSLVAIVLALSQAHGSPGGKGHLPAWILALSVSTLVLSWLVVQSLFTLHYAHRYFGDRDKDGSADEGLQFSGAPPTSYRDFLYAATCVGATCQVSDFGVTTAKFRNLITVHCLISFVFNTMVLALGINIFGNVMGQ